MKLILEIRKVKLGEISAFTAFLRNNADLICNYYFTRYERINGRLFLYRAGFLLASFNSSLLNIKEVSNND